MYQFLKLVGREMSLYFALDESLLHQRWLLSKFASVNSTVPGLFYSRLSFTVPPEGAKCKLLMLICRPQCMVLVLVLRPILPLLCKHSPDGATKAR